MLEATACYYYAWPKHDHFLYTCARYVKLTNKQPNSTVKLSAQANYVDQLQGKMQDSRQ